MRRAAARARRKFNRDAAAGGIAPAIERARQPDERARIDEFDGAEVESYRAHRRGEKGDQGPSAQRCGIAEQTHHVNRGAVAMRLERDRAQLHAGFQ